MMSLERTSQAYASAISRMFERYLDRCELTMREVFHTPSNDITELRAWLFDSAPTAAAKMGIMHNEPISTVMEYLGIDESGDSAKDFSQAYNQLAEREKWSAF